MENNEFVHIREEKVEMNGEVVSKKIISEKKEKKGLLNKNSVLIDLIFKIIGIVTIVLAVLQYFHQLSNDQAEQKRQFDIDQANEKHYQDEQLKSLKDERRSDLELALKQQETIDKQINFKADYDLKREDLDLKKQQLDSSLASSLKQIYLQKNIEIDKEIRERDFVTLTSASSDMEQLLYKPNSSEIFLKAEDNLLYEMYPRIGLIGNKEISNEFGKFKRAFLIYKILKETQPIIDSIQTIAYSINDAMFANFRYEDTLLRSLSEQAKDGSGFYIKARLTVNKLNKALEEKASQIQSLSMPTELPGLNLNWSNLNQFSKFIKDTLNNSLVDYMLQIGTVQASLQGYKGFNQNLEAVLLKTERDLLKSDKLQIQLIDTKSKLDTLSDEILSSLRQYKKSFDFYMNQQLDKYYKNH